jgi:hypothetical protein
MSSPVSYDLMGQGGGVVLSNGDSETGVFRWVQVLNDTVFSSFTASNLASDGSITGSTIPAGIGIGGRITTIGVTTGLVIAYFA